MGWIFVSCRIKLIQRMITHAADRCTIRALDPAQIIAKYIPSIHIPLRSWQHIPVSSNPPPFERCQPDPWNSPLHATVDRFLSRNQCKVINPRRSYGPTADIWSLGCTVLEMLTRQVPYPKLEWTKALYRIGRGERPPIPSSLSRDAQDFIRRCLQVNPEDRPSASQLLDHPFVRRPLPASTGSVSSLQSKDGSS